MINKKSIKLILSVIIIVFIIVMGLFIVVSKEQQNDYAIKQELEKELKLEDKTIEENESETDLKEEITTKDISNVKVESEIVNSKTENTSSKQSGENSTLNKQSTNHVTAAEKQEENEIYTYETDGNKYYFEKDRGENGNYGEKFTW